MDDFWATWAFQARATWHLGWPWSHLGSILEVLGHSWLQVGSSWRHLESKLGGRSSTRLPQGGCEVHHQFTDNSLGGLRFIINSLEGLYVGPSVQIRSQPHGILARPVGIWLPPWRSWGHHGSKLGGPGGILSSSCGVLGGACGFQGRVLASSGCMKRGLWVQS